MRNCVSNQKSLKVNIPVDQSVIFLPIFWLPSFKSSLCSSIVFFPPAHFSKRENHQQDPPFRRKEFISPSRVSIPPSWSWNLHCDRCSETRSMHPSPSTPGSRLKKPSGSMESVDEKFYEVFNVEKCHPGWSGFAHSGRIRIRINDQPRIKSTSTSTKSPSCLIGILLSWFLIIPT